MSKMNPAMVRTVAPSATHLKITTSGIQGGTWGMC